MILTYKLDQIIGSTPIAGDSYIIGLSALYRFPIDTALATYIGPDFTYSAFEETSFLGAIFGAQYQLHPRFGVFGEVGLSLGLGEIGTTLTLFNTGAGVVFYLNQ